MEMNFSVIFFGWPMLSALIGSFISVLFSLWKAKQDQSDELDSYTVSMFGIIPYILVFFTGVGLIFKFQAYILPEELGVGGSMVFAFSFVFGVIVEVLIAMPITRGFAWLTSRQYVNNPPPFGF